MKRGISLVTLVAMVPLAGLAYDANQMFPVLLVPPQDVIAAQAATGTAVNVSAYKGNAMILALAEKSQTVGRTNTFTVQHSTTGASNWTTLTNTAGAACVIRITGTNTTAGVATSLGCDLARSKSYMRGIVSGTGTPQTNGVSLILIAPMKSN